MRDDVCALQFSARFACERFALEDAVDVFAADGAAVDADWVHVAFV